MPATSSSTSFWVMELQLQRDMAKPRVRVRGRILFHSQICCHRVCGKPCHTPLNSVYFHLPFRRNGMFQSSLPLNSPVLAASPFASEILSRKSYGTLGIPLPMKWDYADTRLTQSPAKCRLATLTTIRRSR